MSHQNHKKNRDADKIANISKTVFYTLKPLYM